MSIRIDSEYFMTNASALHQTLEAAAAKKQCTKNTLFEAQTKLSELLQLVTFAHYRVSLAKDQTIVFIRNLSASVEIINEVSNQEFLLQLTKIVTLAKDQDHPEISSLIDRVENLISDFKYVSEENIAEARQFQDFLKQFQPVISDLGNNDKPTLGQMEEDEQTRFEEQLSDLEGRYANPNFFKNSVPEQDFTMFLESYKALKIRSFQFEKADERIDSLLEESELMLGVIITAQEQLELNGTRTGGMLNPAFTELKNTTETILDACSKNNVANIDIIFDKSDTLYRKLSQSEKADLLKAFNRVLREKSIAANLPIKTTKSSFRFWGMEQEKVKWEHRLCALENILASAPAISIIAQPIAPEMKRRLQEINEMTPPVVNPQLNMPNTVAQSTPKAANDEVNVEDFIKEDSLLPLQMNLNDSSTLGNTGKPSLESSPQPTLSVRMQSKIKSLKSFFTPFFR